MAARHRAIAAALRCDGGRVILSRSIGNIIHRNTLRSHSELGSNLLSLSNCASEATNWGAEDLSSDEEVLLVSLLDQYLIDIEEGRQVDVEQLIARHPKIAESLRRYLNGLQIIRDLAISEESQLSKLDDDSNFQATTSDCLISPSELRQTRGSRLGPYQLEAIIGRGAMGIVYRAIDLRRQHAVAVKVLAYGTSLDSNCIDRFRREAKTTAALDHPNVVPVYAVGCERHVNYYSMQLIEGESLDLRLAAAVQQQSLSERPSNCGLASDILGSFSAAGPLVGPNRFHRIAQLCAAAASALHAAHTVGVIHRDIKPSNLLLGNDGQLWVTDFGLARIQNANSLTKTGELVGTLRYMSPEQASGKGAAVDARSDVYALGTTLYELATYVPAFTSSDSIELLKEIRAAAPVAPRVREPQLPRDLETIILRAMRPHQNDRYQTAAAMAEDLLRFAAGKPIATRSITLVECLTRCARRHRNLTMALSAICVFGLLLSLSVTSITMRAQSREIAALQRSDEHYRQAREIVDTLGSEIAQRLLEFPEAEALRRDVLASTIKYYEQFIDSSAKDHSLQYDVARTRLEIARLHSFSGNYAQADAAYRGTAELCRSRLDPHAPDHKKFLPLYFQTLNGWALLANSQGEHQLALDRLERLVDQFPALGRLPIAEQGPSELTRAMTHNNLAVVLLGRQDIEASSRHLRSALDILRETNLEALPRSWQVIDLADALSNLSVMLGQSQQFEEAAAAALQSLRLRTQQHPKLDAEQLGRLAITHSNLAALYAQANQMHSAVAAYRQAIELLESAVRMSPGRSEPQERLAITLNNLGMALTESDDFQAAEQTFERAASLAQPAAAADPSNPAAARRLAAIKNNQAVLLRRQLPTPRTNGIP